MPYEGLKKIQWISDFRSLFVGHMNSESSHHLRERTLSIYREDSDIIDGEGSLIRVVRIETIQKKSHGLNQDPIFYEIFLPVLIIF